MVYKLFNENGDFEDITTGESKNLISAESVNTPEGVNVGWTEFSSEEEALCFFNIRRKIIEIGN